MPDVEIKDLNLLILAFQAFVLLILISYQNLRTFLMSRNEIFLIYFLSFLFYSFLFLGMIFQSLGFEFANMSKPEIFLAWRQFQIIWIGSIYFAISRVFFEKKIFSAVLSVFLIFVSYSWFFYGLILSGSKNAIEFTMYGFLYFIWIPLCFSLGTLFLWYGKKNKLLSPKYLGCGFILLAITYMAWSPWHLTSIYFIWFSVFNISLVLLLIGFSLASIEKTKPS